MSKNRFTTAWRGDDDATLALAEWSDQIDDADAEEIIAFPFQMNPLIRKKRGEFIELLRRLVITTGIAFDFDHFMGGEVFVAFPRSADADFHQLAHPQAEIAEHIGAEMDIILARAEAALGIPQHCEIILGLLQHPLTDQTGAFMPEETQQLVNQLAFGDPTLNPGRRCLSHRLEFGERLETELIDIDRGRSGRDHRAVAAAAGGPRGLERES